MLYKASDPALEIGLVVQQTSDSILEVLAEVENVHIEVAPEAYDAV
jgi:hypothetical protein